MNSDAFRAYLKEQVVPYGSQRKAAKAWGVSPQYLNDVLRGYRNPGTKILQAVGYRVVVRYEPVDKEQE